jgi:hypothetical protein
LVADPGVAVVQVAQTGGMVGQDASLPADFSHSLTPGWAAITNPKNHLYIPS